MRARDVDVVDAVAVHRHHLRTRVDHRRCHVVAGAGLLHDQLRLVAAGLDPGGPAGLVGGRHRYLGVLVAEHLPAAVVRGVDHAALVVAVDDSRPDPGHVLEPLDGEHRVVEVELPVGVPDDAGSRVLLLRDRGVLEHAVVRGRLPAAGRPQVDAGADPDEQQRDRDQGGAPEGRAVVDALLLSSAPPASAGPAPGAGLPAGPGPPPGCAAGVVRRAAAPPGPARRRPPRGSPGPSRGDTGTGRRWSRRPLPRADAEQHRLLDQRRPTRGHVDHEVRVRAHEASVGGACESPRHRMFRRCQMAVSYQLVIDCTSPDPLARFWAEALHYVIEPPPAGHDSWDEFYRSIGVARGGARYRRRQHRRSQRRGPADLVPDRPRAEVGQEPHPHRRQRERWPRHPARDPARAGRGRGGPARGPRCDPAARDRGGGPRPLRRRDGRSGGQRVRHQLAPAASRAQTR